MTVCDAWDKPKDARIQTKSWRVNVNVEEGEKAETTVQANAFPPHGPKYGEIYGSAENQYYKSSHESKWKGLKPGEKPFRVYVRGGMLVGDASKAK